MPDVPANAAFTPLPWERIVWTARSWSLDITRGRPRPKARIYILTDLRLVVSDPSSGHSTDHPVDEIVELDVRAPTPLERLTGRRSLIITRRSGDTTHDPVVLDPLSRRQILGLVQQLVGRQAAELVIDPALVEEAVGTATPVQARTIAAAVLCTLALATLALRLDGDEPAIQFPQGDAIYPGGVKRSTADIVLFMEREVMPWARQALGPVVGGADRVSCATCHGLNGEDRGWAMPGVAELPYPRVRAGGLGSPERYAWPSADPQLRNAVYADLAQDDRQFTAGYMRQVVMPGMARLLGRPTYDFARPYRENRSRFAFGCYHCHRVR